MSLQIYKNIPLKSFWQQKAVCCKVEFPQNHKLSETIIVKISSTIRSYWENERKGYLWKYHGVAYGFLHNSYLSKTD